MSENEKRAANYLNRQQQRQLEDWINSQWKLIEQMRPSRRDIAVQAAQALRFTVTDHNVSGAITALGKTYRGKKEIKSNKSHKLDLLFLEVRSMARRMNFKLSDEFERLAAEISASNPPAPAANTNGAGVSEKPRTYETRPRPGSEGLRGGLGG